MALGNLGGGCDSPWVWEGGGEGEDSPWVWGTGGGGGGGAPWLWGVGELTPAYEKARGSDLDNQRYCKKDNDVVLEVGEPVVKPTVNTSSEF